MSFGQDILKHNGLLNKKRVLSLWEKPLLIQKKLLKQVRLLHKFAEFDRLLQFVSPSLRDWKGDSTPQCRRGRGQQEVLFNWVSNSRLEGRPEQWEEVLSQGKFELIPRKQHWCLGIFLCPAFQEDNCEFINRSGSWSFRIVFPTRNLWLNAISSDLSFKGSAYSWRILPYMLCWPYVFQHWTQNH